jgi:maleylacetoacetate isomerase
MKADKTLKLYSYWRSSAAYRVRIALNLKGLDYEQTPVHLVRRGGEQHGEAFKALNPQELVPVLVHDGKVITQSLAICEYLEEVFPAPALLPSTAAARALVRSLALQVACEIHPLNNLRVQNYLKAHCGEAFDTLAWMAHWMQDGFAAIEQRLGACRGPSDGFLCDEPGLFECLLLPQVYNAERFDIDLDPYPRIRTIVSRCRALPAFVAAAPENQPDAE